jgi:acetyl-CoA C-acetyltransferase
VDSVDLFEINEAFSVVAMAAIYELGLDPGRVNVNGGAVALGHPIGASGARILVTLLHAMLDRGARRGVAAICLGGGEALALAIERC